MSHCLSWGPAPSLDIPDPALSDGCVALKRDMHLSYMIHLLPYNAMFGLITDGLELATQQVSSNNFYVCRLPSL